MLRTILFLLLLAAPNLSAASKELGVTLDGELVQGALIRGQTLAGSTVLINDTELTVSPSGHFVFGFDRDAPSEHNLVVHFPDGSTLTKALNVKQRQYNIQRVEGIKKSIMQPSEANRLIIAKNVEDVVAARNHYTPTLAYLEPFIWPTIGPITGVYGSQRFYNGEPSRPHFGVDVGMPTGTLVKAAQSGIVRLAQPDMFYSGGTIIIDHGYGINSSYLHLSKLFVEVGQTVSQGDPIGEIGATGRSTGPHLDWRLNWYHVRLDPEMVVPPMPKQP